MSGTPGDDAAKPARILLFDVENAPNLAYVWGLWETNALDVKRHWYMLSFACKWLGDAKIKTHALPDYATYKEDREDDRELVQELWHYLDQADIVVAHNGDKFDLKKANARFVTHGLHPPSPYKSIDTLKLARKHFCFDSNKLDTLARHFGLGGKLPNTGFDLWSRCMQGDPEAWRTMRNYNAQDVRILEGVYLKLRPWSTTHPNLSYFTKTEFNCPVCSSSATKRSGWRYLMASKRQRRTCLDCGHRYDLGRSFPL